MWFCLPGHCISTWQRMEWAEVYCFLWLNKVNIAGKFKMRWLIWVELTDSVKPCLPKCSFRDANRIACTLSRQMQICKMHKQMNVCRVGDVQIFLHSVLYNLYKITMALERSHIQRTEKGRKHTTWWHTKPTREGHILGHVMGAVGLTHLGVETPPR